MRNIISLICVLVLVLEGVQSGATEEPTEKPIFKVSFGNRQRHTDNVASASTVSAKTVVKANDPPAKTKASPRDESLVTAESQSQHQFVPVEDPRSQPQQLQQSQQHQVISESEYLALIQGSQAAEENSPPQPQHHQQPIQQQYHKLPSANQIANTYYTKGHPLAGSSLEKEIEKLVSSNSQQYHAQNHVDPEASQQQQPIAEQPQQQFHHPVPPQQRPHHQPQQYRPPVVYKNGNDIVYIPYQQQLLHRDQYPFQRPAPGVTKAKIQYITANPSVRAPFPSEAIEYGPTAGNAHHSPPPPQFAPIKSSESFKELYLQQQQQNHLKRLQAQQQLNRDNLNLHTHAQPQAIAYTSTTNNSPTGIKPQPQLEAYQPQAHPANPAPAAAHSNIAQLAERLFKTPLDQQKPLSQAEFKALVAAGYPVQAVPVHTVVGSKAAESAPQQQFPQRYSPSSVSIPYPQPFSKEPQQQPQQQQQQVTSSRIAAHQPHRLFLQRPYQVQQVQNHHVQPQQYAEQKGQYTYVLQAGENEENAAEKLRQRIIHEINSQTHRGVANSQQVPPQITAGYAPSQIEYQPDPQQQQQAHPGQGQLPQQIPPHQPPQQQQQAQQQGDPQKPYYKRVEYY